MNKLVNPRRFLLSSIGAIGFAIIVSLGLLAFGSSFHMGEGEAASDEYLAAAFTFCMGFALPGAIICVAFLKRGDWKATANRRIYRWQGWTTAALLITTSILMMLSMTHAVIIADYQVMTIDANQNQQPGFPCQYFLGARVAHQVTFFGGFLTVGLALELFKPEDSTTVQIRAKK